MSPVVPPRAQNDFSGYQQFNAELRNLTVAPFDQAWSEKVKASLDGYAGVELQRLVELPTRRAFGAFFTGSVLAEKLLSRVRFRLERHFVYDPTVGAGDLLLAAARRFPLGREIGDTLKRWGEVLAGTDLQPEFIEAAKLRIALLARERHGGKGKLPRNWKKLFPHIRRGDGLEQTGLFGRATHVLLNPPYTVGSKIEGCSWTEGKVSDASLFTIRALELSNPKTRLLAILPEVLRAGSFQASWRERLSDLAEIEVVERYGIFDNAADVDVFTLAATRRSRQSEAANKRWPKLSIGKSTILDYFDVHVGHVVPHRDAEVGPLRRYIHPRNIPMWKEVTRITEKRHHRAAYKPPFVVLRRTSRPGHPYRAAATIIVGKRPVAVENHLIVCEPKDKSVKTCRKLMAQLKSHEVNDFLDTRISCRHLTVGAVGAIPIKL